MLIKRTKHQVISQIEVDTDCKMFCQTLKCKCNTVVLIVKRLCLDLQWLVFSLSYNSAEIKQFILQMRLRTNMVTIGCQAVGA